MPEFLRYSLLNNSPTGYVNDRGLDENVVSRMARPSDLTAANMQAIITQFGGTNEPERLVCINNDEFAPRTIKVQRKTGNAMSFKLYDRSRLETATREIHDLINSFNADNPVVCMMLEGEKYKNILRKLRTGNVAATTVTPLRPPAGQGKSAIYYTGQMSEYRPDAVSPLGINVPTPYRILTDVLNNRPSPFDEVTDCLGPVDLNASCAGDNGYKPRRYIITFATNDPAIGEQTIQVPVHSLTASDILQCGQNWAANGAVRCIGYEGESFPDLLELI